MKPDFSVIIPTKNCLPFLKVAIHSAFLQEVDGVSLELIIIDDNSNDGTVDYLKSLNNAQIKVLNGNGEGASAARNLAIPHAKADLIAFLDADDVWWEGKLKQQLAFHKTNPEVVFSFSDYVHFNERGKLLGNCFEFWNSPHHYAPKNYHLLDNPESTLLATNLVGTSCVVVRTDALKKVNGFRTDLKSAEDWDLWLKLSGEGKVGISSAVTMSYLMREGSISTNKERRISAMKAVVSHFENHSDPLMREALNKAEARITLAEAELAHEKNQNWLAFRLHTKAFLSTHSKRTFNAAMSDVYHGLTLHKAA